MKRTFVLEEQLDETGHKATRSASSNGRLILQRAKLITRKQELIRPKFPYAYTVIRVFDTITGDWISDIGVSKKTQLASLYA